MKVIDLPAEQERLYCQCLEEWSDEMREAGDHKEKWFEMMKGQGLRVKVAIDEQGVTGGMIQYLPIEKVAVEGKDLYFMYCIWVHGYTKGRFIQVVRGCPNEHCWANDLSHRICRHTIVTEMYAVRVYCDGNINTVVYE